MVHLFALGNKFPSRQAKLEVFVISQRNYNVPKFVAFAILEYC